MGFAVEASSLNAFAATFADRMPTKVADHATATYTIYVHRIS
jgi:hypothetical protein